MSCLVGNEVRLKKYINHFLSEAAAFVFKVSGNLIMGFLGVQWNSWFITSNCCFVFFAYCIKWSGLVFKEG